MSQVDVPININLSQDELVKMNEVIVQKTRVDRKNSIEKHRSSVRNKRMIRQSALLGRDQNNLVQLLTTYLDDVDLYIQKIDEFCQKRRMNYLKELKGKMNIEEYKAFLGSLQVFRIWEGGKLIEQGKYSIFHYIMVQGGVAAYHEKKTKEQQKQYIEIFEYQMGEVLLSNMLQTHKANPYTVKAKKTSLLLRFKDDVYIKYLKRIAQKQMDDLSVMLSHSLVFKGISAAEIKKFLPYGSIKRYRYNELVYSEGDLIRQLFLILDGQAQISYDREDRNRNKASKTSLAPLISPNFYRMNHEPNDKKEIKIVRVGKRQLFGLQAYDIFNENYYQHHVKVSSDGLKTLALGLNVLYEIQLQNPSLEENLNNYLKKINQVHCKLLEKSQQVAFNIPPKKKKKKRRVKRKNHNSLEWWGLAAKIEDSKKYRLPTPPKNQSAKHLTRKEPLQIAQRVNKLDYFKRRLFQDEIQALEAIAEKQNTDVNVVGGLVPRLNKLKIKMLNPHPKVINNAERIKRKLLDYAKNEEVFCDKLQLE